MDARYRIKLAEVETGIVLNEDGSRYIGDEPESWGPRFDLLEDALSLKDQLLQRFPLAEVWILDGPDGFEPQRFWNRDR